MSSSPSLSKRMQRAACLALMLLCAPAAATELAVVVHPELSVQELSFERLRRLYMGDQQFWPGGKPVTLLVPQSHTPSRTKLLDQVLRLSENQFRQHWIAKVFRAESVASPKIVPDAEAAQELVSMIPGAIAVVPAPGVRDKVKLVRIDGKLPGDADYRLR